MKIFPWLIDHAHNWQKLVAAQRAPHAIMLTGAKGVGKSVLANKMAHIALCENLPEKDVCYDCVGCQLFAAGNHTDFSVVQAEKSIIKIDQIRSLTKDVVLSSTRNQYRVAVIENVEQMNKASANALLKTLEEPPSGVVLILTTNDFGGILPTIKSRCVKVNLSTPPQNHVLNWIKSVSDFNEKDIRSSVILANGAPLIARDLLNDNIMPIIEVMLKELFELQNKKSVTSVLEITKRWHSEELYIYFPFIIQYFLSQLRQHHSISTAEGLTPFNGKEIGGAIQKQNSQHIFKFLSDLYLFEKRRVTSLKIELLLEELLISWKNHVT